MYFSLFVHALAVGVTCGPVKIENRTSTWSTHDQTVYEEVKEAGCMRRFGGRSPCLKVFFKTADQTYAAICGKGQSK